MDEVIFFDIWFSDNAADFLIKVAQVKSIIGNSLLN
jgi:hypothetical protein